MHASKQLAVLARATVVAALLVVFCGLLAVLPGDGLGAPTIVFAQGPVVTVENTEGSPPATARAVASFPNLWNQYDAAFPAGVTSQNFVNDSYDSFTADDFVIATGQTWSIITVEVDGNYTSGTASSVNVFFYTNNPTTSLPGNLITSRLAQPFAAGPADGDFIITLSPPVVLGPGHYWMSVQANQDSGQWFWNERSTQYRAPAAWRNPGGGLGIAACVNWGVRSTTCELGSTVPDQVFRLSGAVGFEGVEQFCNVNSLTIPTSGQASLYPSNITVSGMGRSLADVNVVLNRLSHTYPRDLDLLLVGPANQSVLVMSDVGASYDLVDITLVLDDRAGIALPELTQVTNGIYKPANYSYSSDDFASPAPAPPYSGALSAFKGTNPNGTWHLYLMDNAGGDAGTLSGGWCLEIRAPTIFLPHVTR